MIVTAVLPIVIGAIAVGVISVFSLQTSVANRLTDSGDAQVIAIDFQRDVQSATMLTTSSSATNPAPCGTGVEVLGLQLGPSTEVTYAAAAAPSASTYTLSRNLCSLSGGTPTLQNTVVVGRDLPASTLTTSPVTIPQCLQTPPAQIPACNLIGSGPAYETTWVSPIGITAAVPPAPAASAGVNFKTIEPGSGYSYTLTAVPNAAANSASLAQSTSQPPGGSFPVAGTGTYASTLFFVNFADWNTQTTAAGVSCTGGTTGNPVLPMAAPIANTPDTLSFCLSVTAKTSGGQSITGQTSAGAACGVAARSGWDDITAVTLPTYSCPPGSEAYLGNNGFYTVPPTIPCPTPSQPALQCPFDPALYEVDQGSTATITISNIEIVSSSGLAATGWDLVTGDAESTDPTESIKWQSTPATSVFTLLPNSSTSEIGNACDGAPPANLGTLMGLATTTVQCSATHSRDKTGTPMIETETPSSLTMTLVGQGLQAVFLGVLLP